MRCDNFASWLECVAAARCFGRWNFTKRAARLNFKILSRTGKTALARNFKNYPGANLKAARLRQNFKNAPTIAIKFKNFIKENDGKKRDFT